MLTINYILYAKFGDGEPLELNRTIKMTHCPQEGEFVELAPSVEVVKIQSVCWMLDSPQHPRVITEFLKGQEGDEEYLLTAGWVRKEE